MQRLDAVTGGPDMGRVGAQVVVDDDAAGSADADAGGPRQVRVGPHAEPDDHEVGRQRARRGGHGRDASAGRAEAGDRGAEPQVDARGAHRSGDAGGHVGVQHGGHRRVQPFHDRHFEAAFEQALCDFQPDVAGADDDGAPGARAEQPFDLRRVVQGAQLQHTLRVDARPGRRDPRCAGADEQFVVGQRGIATAVEVAHGHGRRLDVDGDDLVPGADVDAFGPVLFRRAGNQVVGRLHEATDQVRQAAGGVGGSGRALEDDDLEFAPGFHASRLRRRRHACGVAADDHQPS